MSLFGGDPRYIYLEVILKFNIWFDIFILPIMFISKIRMFSSIDPIIELTGFIIFEILRISLQSSHRNGDIPIYMAFLILSVVPSLVFDVLWSFVIPQRTYFDVICMSAFFFLHIVQGNTEIISFF